MIQHVQFCGDLMRALYHALRERYYRAALNHVGLAHPDAWLISRRLHQSQSIVNDFMRRI
jgi:hypothetical protein